MVDPVVDSSFHLLKRKKYAIISLSGHKNDLVVHASLYGDDLRFPV